MLVTQSPITNSNTCLPNISIKLSLSVYLLLAIVFEFIVTDVKLSH